MVGDTHVPEVAEVRQRALREWRMASHAVGDWLDLIRQGAEKRVGSAEADDVVCDPAYNDALRIYAALGGEEGRFASRAAAIEAGEGR
ncbi:hypothetical protein [Qaidamihabitans albus]|uniref:hypothetical protein n=1 Tax=Qaidamihabitans albus TaxID=2795733 RepID=UPI0018F1E51E|nr:hypothetical protein [Qaidamihabitans albus]